ncbi:MAG: nitronate monooxygenase [Dehalococcoidia bacterium]|nr:nitronate monooxygenase [Dehalococcoidia bacterium]
MKTRMTELFGIKHPIMCGGMMWLCKPDLCAAISNAGGLGNITSANYKDGKEIRQAIREVREKTDKPFSVNLSLLPSFRITKEMYQDWFDACVAEKVPAFEISGTPVDKFFGPDAIKRAHDAGCKFIHKLGSVRHAVHAEHAGYDAVIAAGVEEGGHPLMDDVTTMVLTPRMSESVKIPVITTGGIADGRSLAAAIVLGAEGVMMASRFMATKECRMNEKVKQELISRQEFDTLLYGKTIGFQGRAMKNDILKQIQDMEAKHATLNELAPFLSGLRQTAIWDEGDIEAGLMPVGQSIGLIHDVVSCKELLDRMVKDAEALLKGSRLK